MRLPDSNRLNFVVQLFLSIYYLQNIEGEEQKVAELSKKLESYFIDIPEKAISPHDINVFYRSRLPTAFSTGGFVKCFNDLQYFSNGAVFYTKDAFCPVIALPPYSSSLKPKTAKTYTKAQELDAIVFNMLKDLSVFYYVQLKINKKLPLTGHKSYLPKICKLFESSLLIDDSLDVLKGPYSEICTTLQTIFSVFDILSNEWYPFNWLDDDSIKKIFTFVHNNKYKYQGLHRTNVVGIISDNKQPCLFVDEKIPGVDDTFREILEKYRQNWNVCDFRYSKTYNVNSFIKTSNVPYVLTSLYNIFYHTKDVHLREFALSLKWIEEGYCPKIIDVYKCHDE